MDFISVRVIILLTWAEPYNMLFRFSVCNVCSTCFIFFLIVLHFFSCHFLRTLLHVDYQAHVHGVQGAGVPVANSPQNIERVTFNHNRCMYVYTIKYLTILNWELFFSNTNWQNWVIWIFSYIWLMWSLTQSSLYGIQVSSEGRHRMQVDYEKHQWKLLSPGADVNQRW